MIKPVIGITIDVEDPGAYSKFPWLAIRQNYCSAIRMAGGIPILLPNEPAILETYVRMIDGLVISGGAFDIHPSVFGDEELHETVTVKETRTDFEIAITKTALDADKPILGICGGEQLLAVVLGARLIQHIPDEIDNALPHEQPNPRNEPGHDAEIIKGTRLHGIVGKALIPVNSAHHQAVKDVPDGIKINARAPDGVIEGIEDPSRNFCIGVQWHPEFHVSLADSLLFKAFVTACLE